MTVPVQFPVSTQIATGSSPDFTYDFLVLQKSDMTVTANGVPVQQSDFSITGLGEDNGGIVSILTGNPAPGTVMRLARQVPLSRDTDYQQSGEFRAKTVNDDVDRLWMALQDNARDSIGALKYPYFENLDGTLPSAGARKGMLLGFDPVNGVHALYPLPSSIGAGDNIYDTFVSGSDFTPGVTTQLTLSRAPGTPGNLEVNFDAAFQGPDQWNIAGTTLTFTGPIPVGVGKVFVRIGTTLSSAIVPDDSVGDDQLAWGTILNRVLDSIAALKALDGTRHKRAFVSGYYVPGDRGGGDYYLDGTDTTSPDNGGTIIVANDGARWKLVYTNSLSVRQFGAKGDGVTLDTAAIQSWLNVLSANKVRGFLPKGVYLSGGFLLPSNVYVEGEDMFNSVLRARNGLNANFITSTGYATSNPLNGNANIYLGNFTIDANGSNQSAASYPLSVQYVNGLELSRINMINPYGTLMWISQSDNLGSGPGGRLATPYGQYFNSHVYVHDCIFDGTGQVETNADLNVIGSTQGSRIERNTFIGGGANCLSYQFALGGKVTGNIFKSFMRGLFVESCVDCVFDGNDFATAGVRSPLTPGAWYNGIWLASANESYGSGAGYACSSQNVVNGNVFRDFAVSDAINPIAAIRTSGYAGALASNGNLIANNRVTNWWNNAGGGTYHILLEGQCNSVRVTNNVCDGNSTAAGTIGIYLGGLSYGGVSQAINCGANGNLVANINTGVYQPGSTHTGTSIVGNTLNACTQPTNIGNTGQANYVASANN